MFTPNLGVNDVHGQGSFDVRGGRYVHYVVDVNDVDEKGRRQLPASAPNLIARTRTTALPRGRMSSRCPHPRGPCARHCADLSGIRRVRSAARPPSLRCVVDVRPAIGRLLSFRSYPAYSVQFDAATHVVVYMSTTAIASTGGTFTPWGEHKATSLKLRGSGSTPPCPLSPAM